MSFVDKMADVRWDESQIVARMEAHIHESYPPAEELIVLRKIVGALAGAVLFGGQGYALSQPELAEIMAYQTVCLEAQAMGRAARVDAALLNRVLAAESGTAELAPDDAEGLELLAQRNRNPVPIPSEGVFDAPVDPATPDRP